MATVTTPIDPRYATAPDPFEPERVASIELLARPCRSGSSRRAVVETIRLLAGIHEGLHRDDDGTWWTGDWEMLLAKMQERDRWTSLNEIARAPGFEA